VAMDDLSLVLWRERELLDILLFKLEEERLLLASGRDRWLAYAGREVATVIDSIRQTQMLRAVTADAVAADVGLATNPSLRALAEASDEPWCTILLDHRQAFVALTHQFADQAASATTARTLQPALVDFLR
jgi:hypothetical protein